MPQKPQVRAKEKRRLTRRLTKWRAENEKTVQAAEPKKGAKKAEK